MKKVIPFIFFCIQLLINNCVFAQALYESEPNNTPAQANTFSGPANIMGLMEAGDQDGFMWSVSDVDAQYSWSFELTGIAGALTKVDFFLLTFTEDGNEVVSTEKIYKFGSRDGSRPVLVNDLIFEPGDYFIGIARAGGMKQSRGVFASGSLDLSTMSKTAEDAGNETADAEAVPPQLQYRLNVTKGKKLNARSLTENTQDKPLMLRTAGHYNIYAEDPKTWARLEVSEKASQQRWELSGRTAIGRKFSVTLNDANGMELTQATTDQSGKFSLPDLGLEKGIYQLELEGKDAGVIRTLAIRATGQRVEGDEAEPNDQWRVANRVDLSQPVRGSAGKDNDYDYFRFNLSEEDARNTQLIRLDGTQGIKYELCLYDENNEEMQCRTANSVIELADLSLNAGDYGLSVARSKKDAEYTLSMEQGETFKPIREAEPNDKFMFSSGMNAKRIVKGKFDGKDTDIYHFTVSGEPQLWRIQTVGDGVSRISLLDAKGSTISQLDVAAGLRRARLSNLFLLPGSHHVAVNGTDGSYVLRILPIGPPNPDFEREPNDDPSRAQTIRFGQTRFGLLENKSADDYYRFQLTNDEHIRLTVTPPADGQIIAKISGDNVSVLRKVPDIGKPAIYEGLFPPGDYSLYLESRTPSDAEYTIKLERLARFACAKGCEPPGVTVYPVERGELPVSLNIESESDKVAAYLRYGQTLAGNLSLSNQTDAEFNVKLEYASSDYRWRIRTEKQSLLIPAAGTVTVPFTIHIPGDAWANHSVRVSVRAYDDKGFQVESYKDIDVDAESDAIGPVWDWPVPDEILGGVNVAWKELGGRRIPFDNETKEGDVPNLGHYFHQLFDNQSTLGKGLALRGARKLAEVPVTVELAGDRPVEVAGIILNPMGRRSVINSLSTFELQLSLDGNAYQTVLKDRLQPQLIDHSFTLENPVSARFARLLLLSSQNEETSGQLVLGEWKVIASPGQDISNGAGFNITRPELGGHVVWARPRASRDRDSVILTEKADSKPVDIKAGQQIEWVIGFQDERAARITRMEWVASKKAKPEQQINRVKVFTSVHSPVGPWAYLTDWDVKANQSLELSFDKPAWARYVRFSAEGNSKRTSLVFPDTLRIFEQAADEQYRSIIGEWGSGSRYGIYEHLAGINLSAETEKYSANNSRATASTLEYGQLTKGKVALARESDWYSVTIPDARNTLMLELAGDPTVRTILTIEDENGSAVPVRRSRGDFNSHSFKATVKPGGKYFIKVEEPPRSVAFVWDNSGSVSGYSPMIYNAISSYVSGVSPGIDVANMMVLGGDFLLKDWSGEPYILQSALNDYKRGDNSSDAETALIRVTEALAGRPGTKAIVLITDAETGRNDEALWPLFSKVRPRIFAIRVGSSHGVAEDLMQYWANVNDGFYDNPLTNSQMGIAFDRAKTMLRQPASYTLKASLTFEDAPGPGTLSLLSKEKSTRHGAVELILDASGSMLKRVDGKRRINIAKDVLTTAVTEIIPAGTPLALRVFGHKTPNSCQTDLEIKLKPLNPASAGKIISKINAKNLARTPIADSLAKVEADLKKAKGNKIVILVTDGEETCEGKPAEVLKKLADKGFDVRLNIVGFAIDDADLKRRFEGWAEQGGGRYFDASDESSLNLSVRNALRTPFLVYDMAGELVAQGVVGGEPLQLDAGYYRVKVAGSSPISFDKIEVIGEMEKIIEY